MLTTLIRNGLIFDGTGRTPFEGDVGISEGAITQVAPRIDEPAEEVIDIEGQWVMPDFIDIHTHYDAEIELAPSLSESVRHGITTVFMGSCRSCRPGRAGRHLRHFLSRRGLPRSVMLPMLRAKKDWHTLPEYLKHLEALPIGLNVASFVGHSNLRMHVMGFDRSVTPGEQREAKCIGWSRCSKTPWMLVIWAIRPDAALGQT